jgi:quinol monooxygenase YgiN
MIVSTVRILPPPARRLEVLEILRSIHGPVATSPGCAACHIYEEEGPDCAIVLVERWESQPALEAHLRSENYRRILSALELSSSPPQVRFDHVSSSGGLELIERGQAQTARRSPRPPSPARPSTANAPKPGRRT